MSGSLSAPRNTQDAGSGMRLDLKQDAKIHSFSFSMGKNNLSGLSSPRTMNQKSIDDSDDEADNEMVKKDKNSNICPTCTGMDCSGCGKIECCSGTGRKFCTLSCCCSPCIKVTKLSWPVLGIWAAFIATLLIMTEFSADTSFCYFNPVVPLSIIPMKLPITLSKSKNVLFNMRNIICNLSK